MDSKQALNWQIKGHDKQRELLELAMRNNKLAHAYVFTGPQQIGKKTIGRRLAQFLLCEIDSACDSCINCKTLTAGSNADYIEISSDETIKIENIRNLSYKLSLKAYSGKYKVALIDNAHNMTIETSNALLKVLEEPKPDTLIILITDNANRLLPTINSRVQKINFGPLDDKEFSQWLSEFKLDEPDPSFAGRPGYVISLSQDEQASSQNKANSSYFQNFISGSLGQKLVMVSELAEQETPDLKVLLNHWLHHLENRLRQNPDGNLIQKIKGLMKAQRLLEQNVNSKLLLSELMVTTN
ncbi:MAG: DNA polymerase III subunit [Candidatus Doudnabacteria bacterium]|nr:DNA polymerase III subunit [Candidatus Doudnabacteria bacterium]